MRRHGAGQAGSVAGPAALAMALAVMLAACQPSTPSPDESETPGDSLAETGAMFTLTSSVFAGGAAIPVRYTCDGDDISPPLAWDGVPAGTQAFALIMDDPDASGFVHWVILNLGGDTVGLDEGVSRRMPGGAIEGVTGFGAVGYGGPCPPSGTHRYVFTLFALSEAAPVDVEPSRLTADAVRELIEGTVLHEAVLTGTYAR